MSSRPTRRWAAALAASALVTAGAVTAVPAGADTVDCTTGIIGGVVPGFTVPPGQLCDLRGATVLGSIEMPDAGSRLRLLEGTVVEGSVETGPGSLIRVENSTVQGNLSAVDTVFFVMGGGTVGGNLEVDGGAGTVYITAGQPVDGIPTPTVVGGNLSLSEISGAEFTVSTLVCGVQVAGNASVTGATSPGVGGATVGAACSTSGGGNTVGGNLEVSGSSGTFFRVADNVVGGNLTVSENVGPADKRVWDNTVTGTLTCEDNDVPFLVQGNVAAKAVGQCA